MLWWRGTDSWQTCPCPLKDQAAAWEYSRPSLVLDIKPVHEAKCIEILTLLQWIQLVHIWDFWWSFKYSCRNCKNMFFSTYTDISFVYSTSPCFQRICMDKWKTEITAMSRFMSQIATLQFLRSAQISIGASALFCCIGITSSCSNPVSCKRMRMTKLPPEKRPLLHGCRTVIGQGKYITMGNMRRILPGVALHECNEHLPSLWIMRGAKTYTSF